MTAQNLQCPTLVEGYRAYMMTLAGIKVRPCIRHKVDLSGIVQTTMLEAARKWPQGIPPGTEALPWLRRALENNVRDKIREVKAGCRDMGREVSLDEFVLRASGIFLPDDGETPSCAVEREERAARVVNALGALPTMQRDAIVLQYWDGLSLAEIGGRLGRGPTAVAGLLRRGIKRLRELLSAEEEA